MEAKTCSKCNVCKPLSEFPKAKSCKDGHRNQCQRCRSAAIRDWKRRTNWKDRPETYKKKKEKRKTIYFGPKVRRINLYSKYRMTPEDYDRLLARQGGVCALCRIEGRANRWNRLVVDHCHETGRVRGLLCSACNSALGMLGDSVERVQRALDYVEGNLLDLGEDLYVPMECLAPRKRGRKIATMPDNP